jgi:hypothetical protein
VGLFISLVPRELLARLNLLILLVPLDLVSVPSSNSLVSESYGRNRLRTGSGTSFDTDSLFSLGNRHISSLPALFCCKANPDQSLQVLFSKL